MNIRISPIQLHLIWFVVLISGCKRDEVFESIGTTIAGPVDIALSPDESTVYVLNADIDRRFNSGSLLMLDATNPEAPKIDAVPTPRLGRFMVQRGNALIVGFDRDAEQSAPRLQIYDITEPRSPKLAKEFETVCTPINAAAQPDYQYFAVTCRDGQLYIGTFGDNLADSKLGAEPVRQYFQQRRAMYIDKQRELLFMFPGDLSRAQETRDRLAEDQKTVVINYRQETANSLRVAEVQTTDGANEVPDVMELSPIAQQVERETYQFIVYDLRKEAELGFPRRVDFSKDSATTEYPRTYREGEFNEDQKVVRGEHRWLYFNLKDFDGTPDRGNEFVEKPFLKFYRTNFWEAKADNDDPDAFYISQRQPPGEHYHFGNNVIRVRFTGNPRVDESTGRAPETPEFFDFSRVYGFRNEVEETDQKSYTGDFEIRTVKGRPVIVVNHFRDLASFQNPKYRQFSIAAKALDQDLIVDEVASTDPKESFYQLALTSEGVGFTCSFYGQSVIRFEVEPGVGIKNDKPIK